jgi:uncharacterized protein (TIGR02145 family)
MINLNKTHTTLSPPSPHKPTHSITQTLLSTFVFIAIYLTLHTILTSSPASALPLASSPAPSISISPSNTPITLEPTPATTPTEATQDIDITITTTNPTGYTLTAQMFGTESCLRRQSHITANLSCSDINSKSKINQIPNSPSNTLSPNTWALAFNTNASNCGSTNSGNWSPWHQIPISTAPISLTICNTTSPVTDQSTTLRFGTQTDLSLIADNYSGTVVFTAIGQDIPSPTLSAITPSSGSVTGGTVITISGTNFIVNNTVTIYGVTIGAIPASDCDVLSATQIECTTPSPTNTVGAKDITINGWGGSDTITSGFTYTTPPIVTNVNPSFVNTNGGTTITITGTNFTDVTSVEIGGIACTSYVVISDTSISCTTPANTAGDKAVIVTTDVAASNDTISVTYSPLMQSFTTETCAAMTIGGELSLIDARDGKAYRIRKLADNKCWMVDNLAITGTSSTPITLEPTMTDMTSGTYSLGAMTDPNVSTSANYCINLSTSTYYQKCGMHYNWTTATLGSTLSSGTAPDSICPKNWRLPANGEYTTLQNALNWTSSDGSVNTSAWRGLYAGYNGTGGQGSTGEYWSGTAYSSTYAYHLEYSTTGPLLPSYDRAKSIQCSVRCLAR